MVFNGICEKTIRKETSNAMLVFNMNIYSVTHFITHFKYFLGFIQNPTRCIMPAKYTCWGMRFTHKSIHFRVRISLPAPSQNPAI